MARAIRDLLAFRNVVALIVGALLGTVLGIATAQDTASGWLNVDCAKTCAANGYDAEFCSQVCWVPDPAAAAKDDNLDWKCFEACTTRSGRTEPCLASCRR